MQYLPQIATINYANKVRHNGLIDWSDIYVDLVNLYTCRHETDKVSIYVV